MKTVKLLIITTIVAFATISNAQDYKTAVGLRLGTSNGVSIKHAIGNNGAIEGIISTRWHGANITLLYEKHAPAFQVENLKWYYGAGGHMGFWNGYNHHNPWFEDDRDYVVIGIDGILGLEYKLKDIPFAFALDWKPAINLIGYTGFWSDEGALTVRFTFK